MTDYVLGDRIESVLVPGEFGTITSLGGRPRPGEGPFPLTIRWDDGTYCTVARREVKPAA